MSDVRGVAITMLLLVNCRVTHTLNPSVCQMPDCFCANVTGHALTDDFQVTCLVQSLSQSDQTMQKLTSDIASLKLVCTGSMTPTYLTSATFDRVPELRRLAVENCQLTVVRYDVLHRLPSLQELHIQLCVLSQLPADVFTNSVNLSRLTLAYNDLQVLPDLCNLHNSLELLNVSGQNLTSLDHSINGCPSDTEFPKLAVLDVSNNSFSQLPHNMLSKAANLRELYIAHNQISDLSFKRCSKLKVLNALGQKLAAVNFTCVDSHPNFKVLQIEGNGSEIFSISDLQLMTDLTQLHLENLAISDLFWDVLPFLRNLSHLALPVNNLTELGVNSQVSLQHMNLSRNAIHSLSKNALSSQAQMAMVDLSWNKVTKLMYSAFVNLPALQTLDLQHNQLEFVIRSTFQNLSGLQVLILDFNRLETLPTFLLREMPALQVLSVRNNSLGMLPLLKNAPHLVLVNARYNRISLIPSLFGVPQLEYLSLRGNMLEFVRSAIFLAAPLLAVLDLSENMITSVDSFQDHPGLKWVALDYNKIQDLSRVFRDLPQLSTVVVNNNLLERLTSDSFPPSLQTLIIFSNPLTYMESRMFTSFVKLRAVQLGINKLYNLPRDWVQISPNVMPKPAFVLGPNTFFCDCQMAYLKAWALTKAAGTLNSELTADLPDFPDLSSLDCETHFTGDSFMYFEDTPLWHFVCPLTGVLCDDACPCCQNQPQQLNPNCTCILTCPERCRCFHGGSPHIHLYTHVLCQQRNLTEVPDLIPARATHLRLDGNLFRVLGNATLTHITSVMILHLNSSGIVTLEPGCFSGMDALQVLDLSNNSIGRIEEATLAHLRALEVLDLRHNRLHFVHRLAFSQLPALKTLLLSDNMLKRLDTFDTFPPTAVLTLAGNLWSCDCDFVASFLKFLISRRHEVTDYDSLRCYWGQVKNITVPQLESTGTVHENVTISTAAMNDKPLLFENHSSVLLSEFEYSLLCADRNSTPRPSPVRHLNSTPSVTVMAVSCLVVVVALATVTGLICVRWRWEIQAWIYTRLGIRLWDPAARLDRQGYTAAHNNSALPAVEVVEGCSAHRITYDAFVSYSHKDEDFVVNTLVPRLEQQGPRQYQLCLHYRDFPVGDCIADSIMDSVESSQRTILLLSRHFLISEWCRFEFRAAHHHVLREGGHRLILVLLEDLEGLALDPDLRMALKTRTYLTLRDPWFWDKLYFAMPDVPCRLHHRQGVQLSGPQNGTAQPQDGGLVPDSSSDTRADQLLETLELTISRKELSSSHSLAPCKSDEDSDDDGDVDEFKQILVDCATATGLDTAEPDSHRKEDDPKRDDYFTLRRVSEVGTDRAMPNRDSLISPHALADDELLREQVPGAGTKRDTFPRTDLTFLSSKPHCQVIPEEKNPSSQQVSSTADSATCFVAFSSADLTSGKSESQGQSVPLEERTRRAEAIGDGDQVTICGGMEQACKESRTFWRPEEGHGDL